MLELNRKSDLARLRRMALGAQGLLQARPFGQGLPGARKAIKHIGYEQVDSISVIERAHHHVLYCRIPGYRLDMIDRMLLARIQWPGDLAECFQITNRPLASGNFRPYSANYTCLNFQRRGPFSLSFDDHNSLQAILVCNLELLQSAFLFRI